jgi:hypothetical protein
VFVIRPLVLVLLVAFGTAASAPPTAADRTAAYLARIAKDPDPARFLEFIEALPKGGDLHHHLTGAVYAESYIAYAAHDGDCFDAHFAIVAPPCDPAKGLSPATRALSDYDFRILTIAALSLRNYTPSPSDPSMLGHFFDTFFKFDRVVNGHWGEMLAEVVHRAAIQHEIYLETMLTPDQGEADALGRSVPWTDDLAAMRARLDAAGMPHVVADARRHLDDAERQMRTILRCGSAAPDVGCGVTLRYQNQVLRAMPLPEVFAQMLAGFELANADGRVVALNPVQSQDDARAMSDFEPQLRMFAYLHGIYPRVHLSMHAGELVPGLVPPEQMESPSHIRDSIEIGHAERIGHGLDVLYERDPRALLAEMARRHILVEDPLYSHELVKPGRPGSDVILTYLHAGVPIALATDDEGVIRSDLTQSFERAVLGYGITYPQLKLMVRDSLQHAFVAGADLWAAPEDFAHMSGACAGQPLVAIPPAPPCRALLAASVKAQLEWREEIAFARFEARFGARDVARARAKAVVDAR